LILHLDLINKKEKYKVSGTKKNNKYKEKIFLNQKFPKINMVKM
jgi:hypothetical protein